MVIPKNCLNCEFICSEVHRQFSLSFAFELTSGQWTHGSGNWVSASQISNSISSAILSQAPSGLFSEEYHFFSEPSPINDHCPIPKLLASTFTTSAFAKHSSFLPFLSQEMSLNIDINKILPVKVSGVCPKSLSRSQILSQSCDSAILILIVRLRLLSLGSIPDSRFLIMLLSAGPGRYTEPFSAWCFP